MVSNDDADLNTSRRNVNPITFQVSPLLTGDWGWGGQVPSGKNWIVTHVSLHRTNSEAMEVQVVDAASRYITVSRVIDTDLHYEPQSPLILGEGWFIGGQFWGSGLSEYYYVNILYAEYQAY